MARSKVLLLALASAVGIVVIPAILPAGPTGGLDASKFLAGGQFAIAAGVIFLGGLLTSMTPCVWPLIPITVGVFGARQAESRARAVVLTTAYVIGMGYVFSTLGVVAAMAGKAFGTSLGQVRSGKRRCVTPRFCPSPYRIPVPSLPPKLTYSLKALSCST